MTKRKGRKGRGARLSSSEVLVRCRYEKRKNKMKSVSASEGWSEKRHSFNALLQVQQAINDEPAEGGVRVEEGQRRNSQVLLRRHPPRERRTRGRIVGRAKGYPLIPTAGSTPFSSSSDSLPEP